MKKVVFCSFISIFFQFRVYSTCKDKNSINQFRTFKIKPRSIIYPYVRTFNSREILVLSGDFTRKFIYSLKLRQHFVSSHKSTSSQIILVIIHCQIISLRSHLLSSNRECFSDFHQQNLFCHSIWQSAYAGCYSLGSFILGVLKHLVVLKWKIMNHLRRETVMMLVEGELFI